MTFFFSVAIPEELGGMEFLGPPNVHGEVAVFSRCHAHRCCIGEEVGQVFRFPLQLLLARNGSRNAMRTGQISPEATTAIEESWVSRPSL
tara:strand:- start:8409 stop:8678 length:270 start_codon:yes stop_codon:yes gene_type:complete